MGFYRAPLMGFYRAPNEDIVFSLFVFFTGRYAFAPEYCFLLMPLSHPFERGGDGFFFPLYSGKNVHGVVGGIRDHHQHRFIPINPAVRAERQVGHGFTLGLLTGKITISSRSVRVSSSIASAILPAPSAKIMTVIAAPIKVPEANAAR